MRDCDKGWKVGCVGDFQGTEQWCQPFRAEPKRLTLNTKGLKMKILKSVRLLFLHYLRSDKVGNFYGPRYQTSSYNAKWQVFLRHHAITVKAQKVSIHFLLDRPYFNSIRICELKHAYHYCARSECLYEIYFSIHQRSLERNWGSNDTFAMSVRNPAGLSWTTCCTLSLTFMYSTSLFMKLTKCSPLRMFPGTA